MNNRNNTQAGMARQSGKVGGPNPEPAQQLRNP